jgi:uncharacterized protein (TIGR00369 family)
MGSNGPLYYRRAGPGEGAGVVLGFRVEERHCNPMGVCHGGMVATLADMALAVNCHAQSEAAHNRFLPTISLQIDYMASARLGDWVEARAEVLRATKTMLFVQGIISAGDTAVARVSGIFKIGPPFDPKTGPKPTAQPAPRP